MMLKVIGEHTPRSKWTGSPLAPFRQVANTNRGDIGEEFLACYLESFGIPVIRSQSRVMEWDLEIRSKRFVAETLYYNVLIFASRIKRFGNQERITDIPQRLSRIRASCMHVVQAVRLCARAERETPRFQALPGASRGIPWESIGAPCGGQARRVSQPVPASVRNRAFVARSMDLPLRGSAAGRERGRYPGLRLALCRR